MLSNTGQTATEPLRGRELETSEGVVHVARVYARICGCNGMCLAPQGLAVEHPVTLLVRQVVDVRLTTGRHLRPF